MTLTPTDIEQIAEAVAGKIADHLPAGDTPRRWLHLDEAADYAGIGKKRLKTLADDPATEIIGYPDPDDGRRTWIFDKKSLDAYRLRPAREKNLIEKNILENIENIL